MCGIAGFWGSGTQETLSRMVASLKHRGPDDHGLYVSKDAAIAGGIYLGHNRLGILDAAGGKQPFVDEKTKTALVYDGRIYNHKEIRTELEGLGHVFVTSHSDTETALRAFLEWGPACFKKFNGMFALAIHVPERHQLWLARDRFGQKPLFYAKTANGFGFSSEIGALALWDGFDSTIHTENLQRYFAWGYMPSGRTLYRNCFGLPPGSWRCADLRTGEERTERHYFFALTPDHSLTEKKEPALVEELRVLLVQAVSRRLESDAPLGIFLSGGLDSSAILAAAARILSPEQIDTFTLGFAEPSFDESPNARLVADAFGVRHHVACLSLERMQSEAPGILGRMSEPLGDASLIPTKILSAFARQKVAAALSGDGGDELFAGYDPFLALKPASLYDRFTPKIAHHGIKRAVQAFPVSDRNMSLEFKLKRTLRGLDYPVSMRLPVWMSPLTPREIADVFEVPLSAEELYEDALTLWEKNRHYNTMQQSLMFFTHHYLSDNCLVKADRASMMDSLESRAVFLDNDLVDFCERLPDHFKLRGGTRKYLLKKTLQGWLPESVLQLPKKGFGIPLNRWLREMNRPPCAEPGMRDDEVRNMHTAHMQRKGDHRLFLWALCALQALPAKRKNL